jgi:class 3 adenylate cyclase
VFPLRYVTWASTNSYIFAAAAAALGMRDADALAATAGIIASTGAGLVLEVVCVFSLAWCTAAIASCAMLLLSIVVVVRRLATLLPAATRLEAAALSVLGTHVTVTYLAYPVIFFAAQLCGGDAAEVVAGAVGTGTCLSNATEAAAWRIAEGVAKVLNSAVILVAVAMTARLRAIDVAPALLAHARVLPELAPPPRAQSALDALSDAPVYVGLPALVGASIYVIFCAIIDVARHGARGEGAAAAIALVERCSFVLVMAAVAGAFFVVRDTISRLERLRALADATLPARFAAAAEVGALELYAPEVYYIDEPHVTILFCDAVGFTPASHVAAPVDLMMTLGALFRKFDALHAAAGVAKVETAGDQYFSVAGAAGFGARTDVDKGAQARTMARLALDLVTAASVHAWPDGSPVEVRVGLHCGPAVSGFVGGALPRLGVFGRTIVIASRMESGGAAGRVQASADFVGALGACAGLVLVPRVVEVKGVGRMGTFWVLEAGEGDARAGARAGACAGARAGARVRRGSRSN